jgi:hypothetical protein
MNSSIPSITPDTPIAGALYSVDDGEGHYRVAKILAVDPDGVHIRLYKNKFNERPARVDIVSLDLGSIHDPDGFGMGHMPLSYASFSAWEPIFLMANGVDEEELEGYVYWKEAQGGYFGGPGH